MKKVDISSGQDADSLTSYCGRKSGSTVTVRRTSLHYTNVCSAFNSHVRTRGSSASLHTNAAIALCNLGLEWQSWMNDGLID
ncbi:hypothetical protein PoB_001474300 [Plakobranchus ocellatus]|uniref:Uncharacterized protein n=1 Tax=Plakobranchus ocellatus TaxID=259542 RepID=A0AAV3Z140_9GAST|nr:hypothetical protein PoB_001474300 [Plakobranchus ocellatus]